MVVCFNFDCPAAPEIISQVFELHFSNLPLLLKIILVVQNEIFYVLPIIYFKNRYILRKDIFRKPQEEYLASLYSLVFILKVFKQKALFVSLILVFSQ